jgi:putative Holliday junction resolvase
LLGIDFGAKRCGISETDDLQIIASAWKTVPTSELLGVLKRYHEVHPVQAIVVGLPVRMSGELSLIEDEIGKFIKDFQKALPEVAVHRINEMYTSKMAVASMVAAGARKKQRRDKGNVDKISATIILQQYLELKRNERL